MQDKKGKAFLSTITTKAYTTIKNVLESYTPQRITILLRSNGKQIDNSMNLLEAQLPMRKIAIIVSKK